MTRRTLTLSYMSAMLLSASAVSFSFAEETPPVAPPAAPPAADAGAAKKPVEPIEFRKLRDAMPAEFLGMAQSAKSGQKTKMGEVSMSTAEVRYSTVKDDDSKPYGVITTVDYGQPEMAQAMTGGMFGEQEIDQESDDGFTKTTTVQGVKGLLSYRKSDKVISFLAAVGGRIVFNAEFTHFEEADVQKVVDALPLEALKALVPAS